MRFLIISLENSHNIIILRFCNIVEGQAICMYSCTHTRLLRFYKKNYVTCKKIGYYVYLNPHFFISELHYLFIHLWYEVLHWKTPKHHITYENTDGSWSSLSLAQDLTFMKSLNSWSKIQGSTHHYMKRSKIYLVSSNIAKINMSKKK